MIIRNLLNEIRYGKKAVEEVSNKESILMNVNEDTNELVVSQRVSSLVSVLKEDNTENEVIEKLKKIASKLSEFEVKYFDNVVISEAYKKMKLNSIKEDYNTVIDIISDRKVYKLFEARDLAKALGSIQYGLLKYGKISVEKPQNALLSNYIVEEVELIGSILD